MSKFTEEWQKLRKDMGHMVGVMESMASKYGECTNMEETFYNKGLVKGREEGLRRSKAEICENCEYKKMNDLAKKYDYLLTEFNKLSYAQKEAVESVIRNMKK
jgi:hypothetical protein